MEIKRNCIWCISNLCRGKPQVDLYYIEPALPALSRVLQIETDDECLTDACWAVSYLSDGHNDRIQCIIEHFDLRKFVQLIQHPSNGIVTPALRVIGNIVTGNDVQTQSMLDLDVLKHLKVLLSSPKETIRKEACWTISNITAGNVSQIQVLKHVSKDYFKELMSARTNLSNI